MLLDTPKEAAKTLFINQTDQGKAVACTKLF
jgi:hypothetical protein